jgi:AraC-like DNA-binding protein
MSDATNALAVQYVRLISEQLGAMGVPLAQWLELSGVRPAALAREDFVVDLPTFRSLSLDARRMSGEPGLGLLLGERMGVQAHGALGYAAMNSRTIREVLDLIQRYIGLRIALISLSVQPAPDGVRVTLHEAMPLGDIRGMVLEGVLCSVRNVLQDVSMGACAVRAVAFDMPDPGYPELAAAVLRVPVRYDAGWTGFVLPPAVLDVPLRMSDPRAFRLAAELCQRDLLALEEGRSWVARVRRLLLESRIGFPSLEEAARRLHVSPRTLHRRLVAEGTSYRRLVDGRRRDSAVAQLREGDASIEEVAYILGYTDPANFRRAFRRWEGMPPSRWRAAARAGETV